MIKEFTKNSIKSLRADLAHDLAMLNKKYGMEFSLGNASFSSNKVVFKMEVFIPVEGKSKGQFNFEKRVNSTYGAALEVSDFGKTFVFKGESFKIVDAKLTGAKYNILCESGANGKTYCFKMNHVAEMLKS